MNILSSASKTVFVIMALGTVALTVIGKLEPTEYLLLTTMAFQYYFLRKPSPQ